jgi:hypothetical protein
MNEHKIAHGRMFNEIDDAEARSVCVIGTGRATNCSVRPRRSGTRSSPSAKPSTSTPSPSPSSACSNTTRASRNGAPASWPPRIRNPGHRPGPQPGLGRPGQFRVPVQEQHGLSAAQHGLGQVPFRSRHHPGWGGKHRPRSALVRARGEVGGRGTSQRRTSSRSGTSCWALTKGSRTFLFAPRKTGPKRPPSSSAMPGSPAV